MTTSTYNAGGQLTGTDASGTLTTYTYDASGNLAAEVSGAGTRSYAWDYLNRLTDIEYPDSSETNYIYNSAGQRLAKVEGGSTTRFVYDGAKVVLESTVSSDLRFESSWLAFTPFARCLDRPLRGRIISPSSFPRSEGGRYEREGGVQPDERRKQLGLPHHVRSGGCEHAHEHRDQQVACLKRVDGSCVGEVDHKNAPHCEY